MAHHTYTAFGLSIHSAIELPELTKRPGRGLDVVVRLADVECARPRDDAADNNCFHLSPTEACFLWETVGAYQARGGTEIIVEPAPAIEARVQRLPLLGVVLAMLLHQRGLLVLHASAVAVDGGAVVFLGSKGSGKSTLAATLYGRGHALLADDIVALELTPQGGPRVLPGFPQLKLWPDAATSALGDEPDALPRLANGYEKRARSACERFADGPLPLRAIYTLAEGPAVRAERLQPHAALLPLIAHSYVARFGSRLLQGAEASTHLRQCTDLLGRVPMYCLERPRSLPLLSTVAHVVEEQWAGALPTHAVVR